ncbi:MAG: riboflavin biosynthesis protein RibF [Crocinitomicaceae bacterium]|nr:riboflavin biosynthesis protein RibF [Crocinitomicaceae bacterium]
MKVHYSIDTYKNIKNPVITVGTFDGVHIGHQTIIKRINKIAENCQGESVLLTFDPHPRKVILNDNSSLKLINTIDEKINLLEKYGLDHLVIHPFTKEFSRISPTEYVRDLLVNQLNAHHLVIGYDHQFGRNREGNLDLLNELSPLYGFKIDEISAQEINAIKISSTKIRNAIYDGDIQKTNNYLGHRFTLSGTVREGEKIGRTIGFPTANIDISDFDKIKPSEGVYAVKVNANNSTYNGMMNIGTRPTLNKKENITSYEVHIFNFNQNIYNQKITVEFIDRIREEKKFDDINALKLQLIDDQKKSIALLS